jgi:hypothetical protein
MRVSLRRRVSMFCAAVGLLLSTAAMAGATTISLQASSQDVHVGDMFSLNVVLSDATALPVVGAFDLTLAFDPDVFQLGTYHFTDLLGDLASVEALDVSAGVSGHSLNLSLVSLLSPVALSARQGSVSTTEWVLATVQVRALTAAGSAFALASTLFADADGLSIAVSPAAGPTVTVSPSDAPSAVPEPATLALLTAGLLMTCVGRRTFPRRRE